jgi:crotonobetainyl-CoA:carnitine CoA-transferase CaiB-like acyl-CoA transferase
MSAALASLVNQASAYLNAETVPHAMGNRHPSIAPYETLAAMDGALALAVGNDGQFRLLCAAIGDDGLAEDERFATNPARVAHRDELVRQLEARLGTRPAAEWVALLRAVGVPCGPVNDVAAAFADAMRLGLEPVVEQLGTDGRVRSVASPLRLSGAPVSYRRPPPALGHDTDDVVAWLRTPAPSSPLDPA